MKNIYFLLAAMLISGVLSAQNIGFFDGNGDPLPETITIEYDENDSYLEDHSNLSYYDGYLKNKTMSDANLILTREVIAYVTDSVEVEIWGEMVWKKPDDQFCWGLCYIYESTDTFVELGPSAIVAGDSMGLETIVHYTHWKIPGTTTLKYQIKNGTSVEDELTINFVINKVVGAQDNNIEQVSIYPNPASSDVFLTNLDDVERVVVSNLLGQPVYSVQNPGNQLQVNLSDYSNGIYIVTIVDKNNNTRTERIVKQ